MTPIFVHSSFRVSSTWFWTRLRELDGVRAYYECLHERLASVDAAGIDAFNVDCWDSGHPRTGPYFAEFLPLIAPGGTGIVGYDATMAFLDYLPAAGLAGELPMDQRAYLQGLIEAASVRAERAVLTFGRSLGRVGAMRRALGGGHVLLVRDLGPQWASYRRLGSDGVWYFLNATLQVIANGSAEDAFLAELKQRHTETIACRAGLNLLRFTSQQDYFEAMVGMHAYLYRAALPNCDVVLNVSTMARDPEERRKAEARLAEVTGLTPDLSDLVLKETDLPAERLTLARANEIHDAIKRDLGSDRAGDELVNAMLQPLVAKG